MIMPLPAGETEVHMKKVLLAFVGGAVFAWLIKVITDDDPLLDGVMSKEHDSLYDGGMPPDDFDRVN